ncbi:hypothetical protein [Geoglobus ahangari]
MPPKNIEPEFEEVLDIYVYDIDAAIKLLEDIKEELLSMKNAFEYVGFVKITGLYDQLTGSKSFKVHSIRLKPKIPASVEETLVYSTEGQETQF